MKLVINKLYDMCLLPYFIASLTPSGNCWLKTGRETEDVAELEYVAAILDE